MLQWYIIINLLSVSKNTVTIHVKPYVAHYLRLKYQLKGNVIDLPRKSNIREIFRTVLLKQLPASDAKRQTGYTEEIQVFVCDFIKKRHGSKVNTAFASLINGVIEEKIKNEAFHIINLIRVKHNMNPEKAMLEYLSMYNMLDILTLSALKASYYRSLAEAEEIYRGSQTATKNKQHAN